MVRPSAFAVLRLMTSSIFAACSTGRSAGFSPLRKACGIDAKLARLIAEAAAIAHQAAGQGALPPWPPKSSASVRDCDASRKKVSPGRRNIHDQPRYRGLRFRSRFALALAQPCSTASGLGIPGADDRLENCARVDPNGLPYVATRFGGCRLLNAGMNSVCCYPSCYPQLSGASRSRLKPLIYLARPKRFELLTPRFVVW